MGASLRAVRRSGPALPARPCQSLSARCPRRTSSPVSCCAGQTPAPSPAPDPLVPGLDRQVGGSPGLPGRTGEGAKGKLQDEDLGGPGPGGWVGALTYQCGPGVWCCSKHTRLLCRDGASGSSDPATALMVLVLRWGPLEVSSFPEILVLRVKFTEWCQPQTWAPRKP